MSPGGTFCESMVPGDVFPAVMVLIISIWANAFFFELSLSQAPLTTVGGIALGVYHGHSGEEGGPYTEVYVRDNGSVIWGFVARALRLSAFSGSGRCSNNRRQ
jgi:hypothetical protein